MIIYWLCGPISKYISSHILSFLSIYPSPIFIDITSCAIFHIIYPLSNYIYINSIKLNFKYINLIQ